MSGSTKLVHALIIPQACRLCSSLVLTGGAQTDVRVNRRSSILGCACSRSSHFRPSQPDGCAICSSQGEEGAGCGNELSLVGQSREEGHWEDIEVRTIAVGAYQTIPRLKDPTAEHHHGHTGGWSKELDVEMNKIFGARSRDVLKRMQKALLSSSLKIARTFSYYQVTPQTLMARVLVLRLL